VTSALTFSGTSYQLTSLLISSSIIHSSGSLTIDGSVALTARDEIKFNGDSVTLKTGLNLIKSQGISHFEVNAGSVFLGDGSTIDIQGQTDIQASDQTSWALTGSQEEDGFVVLRKPTTFTGSGGIPKLRLATLEAQLTLQSDMTVFDAFESVLGVLNLGAYQLNLESASWTHSGSRFVGSQSDSRAQITVLGPSSISLSAPLVLEFTQLVLDGASDSISIRQVGGQAAHSITIPNRGLTARNGTIDLGRTDIILRGSTSPLLELDQVVIVGDNTSQIPSAGNYVKTVESSYPFLDLGVGEIVVRSVSDAFLLAKGASTVSGLRVESQLSVDPASTPFHVGKRLVFGQSGAGIVFPSPNFLVMDEGSTIVRRGRGTLSHSLLFEGPIGIAYDLDDGSVTGQNRNFQLGELVSGFEIPPSAVGIQSLSLLAGNTGSTLNKVRFIQELNIIKSATIWSGEANWSSAPVTFQGGSTLLLPEIDENAPSLITSSTGFNSTGTIHIKARPLSSSLILTSAMYPESATVDSLVLDMGDSNVTSVPSIVLNGDRVAQSIIISGRPGSALNMTGSSLRAIGNVDIHSGRVFSDPVSSLTAGGSLFLGQNGVIDGNINVLVEGNSTIVGQMQALAFTTAGNLNLTGPWQQSTSLSLNGSSQEFTFNTPEIVIGKLIRSAPTPIASALLTGPPGSSVRVTQQLQLASGQIELNGTSMFLDAQTGVTATSNAWIAGRISRSIAAGYTGSISFPIGTAQAPRQIDLIITNPLLTTSAFGMRLNDSEPVLESGLPLTVGSSNIVDTDTYYWTLTSSVNFANSQSFSLSAPARDPDTSALLTKPAGVINAVWKADNLSSGGVLRSAILTQGLSPVGLHISPGKASRNGEKGWVQWADGRTSQGQSPIDVYLNDELWISNAGANSASAATPISLTSLPVEARAVRTGEAVANATPVSIVAQTNGTVFLVAADSQDQAPKIVSSNAFPQTPGIVAVHTGLSGNQATVTEMWPSANVIIDALDGGSFSTTSLSGVFGSTLKLSSTTGSIAFSKYDFALSKAGPMLFVVRNSMTSEVITPSGQRISPVNATNTEDDQQIPLTFDVLSLYPNPTVGSVSFAIQTPEPGLLEMEWFNVSGQRVFKTTTEINSGSASTSIPVDVRHLAAGTYFSRLTFRTKNKSWTVSKPVVVVK